MLEGWKSQCSCGRVEESKRLTAVSRFNGVNTGGTTAAAGKPKVVPVSPDGLLSLVSYYFHINRVIIVESELQGFHYGPNCTWGRIC